MLLLTTGLDLPSTIPPLDGHELIQLQHPRDVMTPRIDSGIQRQSTPFLQRLRDPGVRRGRRGGAASAPTVA